MSITYYLQQMAAAEADAGKRLVDVLDLHWYSEVYANGQRITGDDNSQASINARVQAPRSLWDPTFQEDSWIANDVLQGPVRLIPWLQERIDAHYPGTGIGFTEYNYGGGAHISAPTPAATARAPTSATPPSTPSPPTSPPPASTPAPTPPIPLAPSSSPSTRPAPPSPLGLAATNAFLYPMPAYSVSVLVPRP